MGTKSLHHVQLLKNILSKHQHDDSKFSLRKFAQFLGVSPTTLSHILSHKKGISDATANRIATKLNLGTEERKTFLLSVQSAHSRNSKIKLESTLELTNRKGGLNSPKKNQNRNEILFENDNFLLETIEVQNLISRTEPHKVYRYSSKKNELLFRILYVLKDRASGKIVRDFIHITFNEKTKQGATVYFIEKENGRFKTYFNNVFDGTDRVTGLVAENQNTEIKFDDDFLPTIPLIRFLVLGENKHVVGKMKYTQSEFTVQGALVEPDEPFRSLGKPYNLKLFRI